MTRTGSSNGGTQMAVVDAASLGVEKIMEIDLNMRERSAFMHSVESVKGLVDACLKLAPHMGA